MKIVKKKEKLSPELIKLARSIGQFIEYWGFKSIHGEVWALLYLSAHPLSSIELSRYLKVSKTLMSFSISELRKYRVIEEAGKGIKRTQYFRANPDLSSVILNVLKIRELPMMSEINSNQVSLSQAIDKGSRFLLLNSQRVSELGEFISSGKNALEAFIHHASADSGILRDFVTLAGNFSSDSMDNP